MLQKFVCKEKTYSSTYIHHPATPILHVSALLTAVSTAIPSCKLLFTIISISLHFIIVLIYFNTIHSDFTSISMLSSTVIFDPKYFRHSTSFSSLLFNATFSFLPLTSIVHFNTLLSFPFALNFHLLTHLSFSSS